MGFNPLVFPGATSGQATGRGLKQKYRITYMQHGLNSHLNNTSRIQSYIQLPRRDATVRTSAQPPHDPRMNLL